MIEPEPGATVDELLEACLRELRGWIVVAPVELGRALLDVQFELPSRRDVKKCVVTRETIEKGNPPTLVTEAAPADESGDDQVASA